MMNIKPKIKKIIIIVAIVVLAGILYIYFSNKSSTPASTSSLESQSSAQIANTSTNVDISSDTAFLATLLSLGKTTIDPSIFSASSFKSLQDNTVEISSNEVVGRINPFIPFDTTIPSDTTTILPEILPTNTTVNSSLFLPNFSSVPTVSTPVKKN